jgi:[ribosomal protein S5]-alanine N-acetyltransferase
VRLLESERMIFRPHEMADFEDFCAMEADAEVRRYVGGSPRTREGAERKFREVQLRPIDTGMGLMAMIFKADGGYIGYCGLYPNFNGAGGRTEGEAVLGFTLARSYWGRGLATEAGDVFVRFGFGELGLSRIVSVVEAGNLASLRVLEKLGFVVVAAEKTGARSFYKLELKKTESREFPSSERPPIVLHRVDSE